MAELAFRIEGRERALRVERLVIAGWTGRDRAAVDHHIAELAAIGVKPPRAVPSFYRVGASLLTTAPSIEVVGGDSSGEVEFVLVSASDGVWVGVGSDHTDRKVESYGVTVSKQMCPKPIGPELWRLADLEDHWDRLVLRSHVVRAGRRLLYQEGPVSRMLAPRELIARMPASPGALPAGTAMFCGTLPVQGEIGGGERFEIELEDPVKKRALAHAYAVTKLEIAD
ncbi:MAG TPA: DUF2848 domain-containing protein [Burkholderiales bacterium]